VVVVAGVRVSELLGNAAAMESQREVSSYGEHVEGFEPVLRFACGIEKGAGLLGEEGSELFPGDSRRIDGFSYSNFFVAWLRLQRS
jgi:hypothetical protein